ncbi:MAG TPA: LPS export ABC transporter periplasmic protein LptC [Gammaproteobacteria bacterium]|nr:LPS export ABC transporter periplasmic protein LptC [Gammaproteobacteria bacterium]
MSRRYIVLFLLLAAVALASGWFLDRLDTEPPERAEGARQRPDYYVENFTATTLDLTGFPTRRLDAAYMAHYPETDTHELADPYLVLFAELATPWHVRSERGWISPDGDEMLLLGKVHIWRNDESGERQVDIRTEDLRVLPVTEYGETDERVVITTPSSESRGVGMRAWMGKGRLELLSQVRTVYERPAR